MKTIQIGSRFEIYTDDLKTHDLLPPQTYVVRFAKMTGFYLVLHAPLEVDEKVYGVHQQKVDKVLSAFGQFSRNLDVILSGKKGIGKSIFARMLGIKAIEQGLPVIIVEQYIPGIASYIESSRRLWFSLTSSTRPSETSRPAITNPTRRPAC